MSIEAIEFLNSAKEYAQNNDEVHKRNAISRAYYAVYHESHSTLPEPEEHAADSESMGVHAKYISYLLTHDAGSVERGIGLLLTKLKQRRVKADYKIDKELDKSDLAMQLNQAEKVLNMLSSRSLNSESL